ncbi:MAG: hypothetical protein ILA34_04610 [Bacteroidaceae bacterium]|nr:hypothetical protein [Bacteroidaceae bacterium]
MKRILPLLLLCVGFLFGCEPDTEIEYRTVVDSVFVHRVDTVYIDRTDTVFVSQTDTVVVTQTDTVVTVVNHTDTIVEVRLDTVLLVRNDTVLVNAQKLLLRTDRQSLVLDSVSRVDRLTVESDVLESLVCDSVGLSELELRTPHLRRLRCAHNRLEKLDVPSCLYELDCRYNDLSLLDLSAFPPQWSSDRATEFLYDSVIYGQAYNSYFGDADEGEAGDEHGKLMLDEYISYRMDGDHYSVDLKPLGGHYRFEREWNYEVLKRNSTIFGKRREGSETFDIQIDPNKYPPQRTIPSNLWEKRYYTYIKYAYVRYRPQNHPVRVFLDRNDKYSILYYFRERKTSGEVIYDYETSHYLGETYKWSFRWEDTEVYMK